MGCLDKKKNEEWIDGTPESFKIWFWIRLAVCLFLFYTGGELIYHYVKGEIGWGAIAGAAVFFVFGIVFMILDISRYLRLRRAMKERDADDTGRPTDASSLGSGIAGSRTLARDASGSPERSDRSGGFPETGESGRPTDASGSGEIKKNSISDFAKYVVNDEEDETDDEV